MKWRIGVGCSSLSLIKEKTNCCPTLWGREEEKAKWKTKQFHWMRRLPGPAFNWSWFCFACRATVGGLVRRSVHSGRERQRESAIHQFNFIKLIHSALPFSLPSFNFTLSLIHSATTIQLQAKATRKTKAKQAEWNSFLKKNGMEFGCAEGQRP